MAFSVTVSFWIKFKALSTSSATNIFRLSPYNDVKIAYLKNNFNLFKYNTKRLSLTLSTSKGIVWAVPSYSVYSGPPYSIMPLNTWTHISVTAVSSPYISLTSGGTITILVNGVYTASFNTISILLLNVLPSDVFVIGGPNSFSGTIKDFSIYTPGSFKIDTRKAFDLKK